MARQSTTFRRVPVLIAIVVVALLLVAYMIAQGRTSASELQVGDCFEAPAGGEFRSVVDQDCDGPHNAQTFAMVSVDADAPAGAAEQMCVEQLVDLVADYELPADFALNVATIESDALCILVSDSSGLVGRVGRPSN